MNNTVNTVYNYVYGSPRYNCTDNLDTVLIPEDYGYWNFINGTYDPNFPLYSLTESDIPKLETVNQANQVNQLKGDLALTLENPGYKIKTIGSNNLNAKFKNSNLQSKIVTYNNFSSVKLNPAWCVIQCNITTNEESKNIYTPRFIIRTLGNTKSTNQIHSLKIQKQQINNYQFPVGMIVTDDKHTWKCIKTTKIYPPASSKQKSEYWHLITNDNNVFNADVFVINNSNTSYLKEVNDKNRRFNPLVEDDTLVCWNLAYWQD